MFLKPLLTFIAIPLIILTFGIAYFFVNVAILAFTEWIVPDFSIDGFWTYVGATIVMWLVNVLLWRLLRAIEGDDGLRLGVYDGRARGEMRMRRLVVVFVAAAVAAACSRRPTAASAPATAYGLQDDAWIQFGPGTVDAARRDAPSGSASASCGSRCTGTRSSRSRDSFDWTAPDAVLGRALRSAGSSRS